MFDILKLYWQMNKITLPLVKILKKAYFSEIRSILTRQTTVFSPPKNEKSIILIVRLWIGRKFTASLNE